MVTYKRLEGSLSDLCLIIINHPDRPLVGYTYIEETGRYSTCIFSNRVLAKEAFDKYCLRRVSNE